MNTPRTRSGGICSVLHIRRQMRKSSLVASTDPLYGSTGTSSHPVAFPLRRALRQTLSASSSRTSPSAGRLSRFWWASAAGRWNLVPRNLSQTLSSCVYDVMVLPSAPLGGLQLPLLSWEQMWTIYVRPWYNKSAIAHSVGIGIGTSHW